MLACDFAHFATAAQLNREALNHTKSTQDKREADYEHEEDRDRQECDAERRDRLVRSLASQRPHQEKTKDNRGDANGPLAAAG